MATLIRKNIYDTVPGLTQPDPISGPTSFSFTPTGQNQQLIYDEDYRVTSPLSDYNRFQQEYSNDTFFFGQLGTGYGAASRYAASDANFFKEVYGGAKPSMSWSGSGVGGSYQINTYVDFDLPNKQAEPGTVAYWNKVYADIKGPVYTPEEQMQRSIKEQSDWIANTYFPSQGDLSIPQARKAVTYSRPADELGWNRPNENYLSSVMGINDANLKKYFNYTPVKENYNRMERLAPTSISQGRGIFTGPIYGTSPTAMNMKWTPSKDFLAVLNNTYKGGRW